MAREERRERRDDRDRDDDRRGDKDRGRDRGRDKGRGNRSYSHHKEENVRSHSEQSGGNWAGIFKTGIKAWRAKEGENAIRILPPTWDGYEHYGYEVYVHNRVGASGSTYTCPRKHGGGDCAACDESTALRAAGEDEDAGKLSAKKAFVYYIIDRDEKRPEPQVWQAGWRQDKEIADASEVKRRSRIKYIDHPDEGYDLFVKRTGKQLNTRYTYQVDSDPSPICNNPDDQDDILKQIEDAPIDTLIKWSTSEQIAKDLRGTTRKGDDDDEGSNRRGTRRGARDDEDSPRRSGRDRDDTGDNADTRRSGSHSRGRDADGDEEDTTSSRGQRRTRAGDDDDADADRAERPSRRERDDEDDRPRRR